VDLLDPADCQAKLGPLTNVSHLFYLAITERPDPGETVSANANMFFNLIKTVEAASPALEHVHLSQGTRWYGNHLGSLQDSDQGGRSAAHAAKFLL
jgi:hypothetical protein